MRNVRHQVVAQRFGVLQVGRHLVEGVGKLQHLAAAAGLDTCVQIARADVLRGPRQVRHRRADDAADHHAGHQSHHQGERHEVEQAPCNLSLIRLAIRTRRARRLQRGRSAASRPILRIPVERDGEELHEEDEKQHTADHQAEPNP